MSFFDRVWLISLQKVLIWPKKIFPNIFNMGIKKCRIWCWFRTVEKVSRKFTQRKLEGWELLYPVLKDEKVHNFYTFMLITFLYEFFYTFFKGFEISIQFCVFWYPYQNVLNKMFVGSYYHFLPTLNPNTHKTAQKTKTFFFQTGIRIN